MRRLHNARAPCRRDAVASYAGVALITAITGGLSSVAYPAEPACTADEGPGRGVYLGYTKPDDGTLRALARLEGGRLVSSDGSALSAGLPMYGVLSHARAKVDHVAAYVSRLGEDHCVYPAALAWSAEGSWEIWASSDVIANELRAPDPVELARFDDRVRACVVQGDPVDRGAACVRPKLLAVSDLDDDGRLEHWSTQPFTWDTGMRVVEAQADGFELLVSACAGCSD